MMTGTRPPVPSTRNLRDRRHGLIDRAFCLRIANGDGQELLDYFRGTLIPIAPNWFGATPCVHCWISKNSPALTDVEVLRLGLKAMNEPRPLRFYSCLQTTDDPRCVRKSRSCYFSAAQIAMLRDQRTVRSTDSICRAVRRLGF